jgi:hypothetical protein
MAEFIEQYRRIWKEHIDKIKSNMMPYNNNQKGKEV